MVPQFLESLIGSLGIKSRIYVWKTISATTGKIKTSSHPLQITLLSYANSDNSAFKDLQILPPEYPISNFSTINEKIKELEHHPMRRSDLIRYSHMRLYFSTTVYGKVRASVNLSWSIQLTTCCIEYRMFLQWLVS